MNLLEAVSGVANASQPLPHLLAGGQPGPAHLKALGEAGVKVIFDIRDPMEPRPFDEAAAAKAAGLEYEQVTVRQGALDDGVMERVLSVLRKHDVLLEIDGRPVSSPAEARKASSGTSLTIFRKGKRETIQAAPRKDF